MSENKIVYGLQDVHIAFQSTTPGTYEAPVDIPGAVKFTTTAVSQQVDFYADNIPYFTIEANNGYTGQLEMALIPSEILAEMLGWDVDSNGMLVEIADAKPKKFALMAQVEGDEKARRFVYYDVMAMRPDQDLETKGETIEPKTETLPVVIRPITINNKKAVKGVLEPNLTNAAAYNGFYSGVLLPDGASTPINKVSLNAAIAIVGKLTEGDWSVGTWGVLDTALGTATTVSGDGTATQKAVNDADKALRAAILGLVPK